MANGQCTYCGAPPAEGRKLCQSCLTTSRKRANARQQAGFCVRCAHGTPATAGVLCLRCWFKKIASDSLGARGNANNPTADALQLLWEKQSGKCALTGATLIPASNASIDHVLPKARGGDDSISNLQWVTFYANVAKRDLTHSEFVALCEQVVAHAKAAK